MPPISSLPSSLPSEPVLTSVEMQFNLAYWILLVYIFLLTMLAPFFQVAGQGMLRMCAKSVMRQERQPPSDSSQAQQTQQIPLTPVYLTQAPNFSTPQRNLFEF
ncbi:hypothetical protein TYRP_023653, partial [Tyrophagus putrescentiae]